MECLLSNCSKHENFLLASPLFAVAPGRGNTIISSMVWHSSSLQLVAYNGLGGPVTLPSYYLSNPTPLTVSFHQNICWSFRSGFLMSTLLAYAPPACVMHRFFPQWNLLIVFISEHHSVSLPCFWSIFRQFRACFFIVLSGLSHLQSLHFCQERFEGQPLKVPQMYSVFPWETFPQAIPPAGRFSLIKIYMIRSMSSIQPLFKSSERSTLSVPVTASVGTELPSFSPHHVQPDDQH